MRSRREQREARFIEYVASRQAHLRRIAYALRGDWHQVEDLLQTALTRLYVAWHRVHRDGRKDAIRPADPGPDQHRRPSPIAGRELSGLDDVDGSVPDPSTVVAGRLELFEAMRRAAADAA